MKHMMEQCKNCSRDITEEDSKQFNGYCNRCFERSEIKNTIEKGETKKEKVHNKGKNNKKYLYLGIILLVICIAIFIICDNINFKKDILQAKIHYACQEYSEAQQILDKYPLHYNDSTYKKIKESKQFTLYYELCKYKNYNEDDEKLDIKYLIYGYSKCLKNIESSNDLTSEVAKEILSVYKSELYYEYKINEENLNELLEVIGEKEKLEQKISTIFSEIKKANTCEKSNVKVISYNKFGYEMDVTLRNENGCTWNIKSYSEVRVYFTDGSYEDVHLGTNINLKSNQEYTFSDCYLGSNNKNKTIRTITFID